MHGTPLYIFHIYILPRNCYEVSNIVYGTCTCKFTLCDLLTPSNITMHFLFKKRYIKKNHLKPLVVAKCSSQYIFWLHMVMLILEEPRGYIFDKFFFKNVNTPHTAHYLLHISGNITNIWVLFICSLIFISPFNRVWTLWTQKAYV